MRFFLRKCLKKNDSEENYTRNEWRRCESYTRNEWRSCEPTLQTSGKDVKIHPKRVEKIISALMNKENISKSEQYIKSLNLFPVEESWTEVKTTLETSGEDVKTTLETSGEDTLPRLTTKNRKMRAVKGGEIGFRVQFSHPPRSFECSFTSSPLVSSVVLHLLHSFRV